MSIRAAGVALAFLALIGVGVLQGNGGPATDDLAIPTAEVTARDFTVLVRAVGELDSAQATTISSQVRGDRGKVIYIIDDGARVERNDIVVRLDPAPFEEALDRLTVLVQEKAAAVETAEQVLALERNQALRDKKTAEFNARLAELDLVKLEKGEGPLELARLQTEARRARQAYEEKAGYIKDLTDLAGQGYSNPTEVVQARRKAEEARQNAEVAEAQLASYRDYVLPTQIEQARVKVARTQAEVREVERGGELAIAKAEAALEQARKELATAQGQEAAAAAELDRTIIRSPLQGMAVLQERVMQGERRKPQVGDVVWQNQPLIYVPDTSRLVVRTQIRELDLHNVETGMAARVFVDAYPDLRLAGTVQSIGVLAKKQGHAAGADKAFSTVIALEDQDARLRPGMTARVEIQSADVTDALAVPIHAVFLQDGAAYCFVPHGATFERHEVALGRRSDDWAQIVDGLGAGRRVALVHPPSDRIGNTHVLPRDAGT